MQNCSCCRKSLQLYQRKKKKKKEWPSNFPDRWFDGSRRQRSKHHELMTDDLSNRWHFTNWVKEEMSQAISIKMKPEETERIWPSVWSWYLKITCHSWTRRGRSWAVTWMLMYVCEHDFLVFAHVKEMVLWTWFAGQRGEEEGKFSTSLKQLCSSCDIIVWCGSRW